MAVWCGHQQGPGCQTMGHRGRRSIAKRSVCLQSKRAWPDAVIDMPRETGSVQTEENLQGCSGLGWVYVCVSVYMHTHMHVNPQGEAGYWQVGRQSPSNPKSSHSCNLSAKASPKGYSCQLSSYRGGTWSQSWRREFLEGPWTKSRFNPWCFWKYTKQGLTSTANFASMTHPLHYCIFISISSRVYTERIVSIVGA